MATLDITAQVGSRFNLSATVVRPACVNVSQPVSFTLAVGVNTGGGSSSISTGTLDVLVTAAEPLGIYRAVTASGELCDPTADDLTRFAGVTRSSIGLGEQGSVVRVGLITEPTWTWTPDEPIFVSANGVLAQGVTALPLKRIGYALSATQAYFEPFPTIGD